MKLFLLEFFAAFFACVLVTQASSYSYRRSDVLSNEPCQTNGICRWVLCPWAQRLYVSNDNCQFLEECRCPSNTSCQRASQIPRASLIIFNFRCM